MVNLVNFGEAKKDPETAMEKFHYFVENRTLLSGVTISGLGLTVLYLIVRYQVFSFLPGWMARSLKITLIGIFPSYIVGRRIFYRFRTIPADVIYENNPAAVKKNRKGYYLQGRFSEEFEFKMGKPLTWTNSQGLTVYSVIAVDEEEKVAWCSWLGDYSPQSVLAFEEKWKEQRMKNDAQRRAGAKIGLRTSQITNEVVSAVSNIWIRDLQATEFEEEITEAVDDVLPEDLEHEREEINVADLEKLEDAATDTKLTELLREEKENVE